MKKIALMSLALMVASGSVFAASADPSANLNRETPSQNPRVINISHLTDNDLKEIMLGQHPEIAIEFSAQTTLPISFFLKGDLVNLVENEENCGAVAIMQTFYARCAGQELFLSTNLTDWKPFFEFMTGNLSASLSIQDGQPSITIGAEANQRF